jgi:Arylsulfotransferase (ASST)
VRRLSHGLVLASLVLALASTGAGPAVAAPASGTASVSARPGLFPAFSAGVSDYVTRCHGERGVSLSGDATGGASVDAAGRVWRGRFHVVEHVGPGREFSFATRIGGTTRSYYVRCLPPRFPQWTFVRSHSSPGHLTLVGPGLALGAVRPYAAIFDGNGAPVWWYRVEPAAVDAEFLPDATLAFAHYGRGTFGTDPRGAYEIRRLNGTLVRRVRAVGSPTDDHELQLTTTGDYALLSYVPRDGVDLSSLGGPKSATVVDAEIQIVSKTGKLLWFWNSKDHVPLSASQAWARAIVGAPVELADGRTAYDIVHGNSVQVVGKTVLLSLRHTNTLYAIDRGTGAIRWTLGGTPGPASLAVSGDPLTPLDLSGQHYARLQADGTLTVHDNGTGFGRPPRVLQFRIDAAKNTATLVASLADPAIKSSFCCGSATRLADRDWLVSWGGNPVVAEYRPGGAVAWKLTFERQFFSYRAISIPSSPFDRARLRAAMNAMNPRR